MNQFLIFPLKNQKNPESKNSTKKNIKLESKLSPNLAPNNPILILNSNPSMKAPTTPQRRRKCSIPSIDYFNHDKKNKLNKKSP